MDMITIVGLMATGTSVIGYVPQILKSWKTRQVKDVSLPMLVLIILSLSSWLTYGLLVGNFHLILTNIISLNLVSLLLIAKLKYGRESAEEKLPENYSNLIDPKIREDEHRSRYLPRPYTPYRILLNKNPTKYELVEKVYPLHITGEYSNAPQLRGNKSSHKTKIDK
ncbi:MAG: SemiSWEET family sugar transporter [Candidatus Hadarchaeia archaeon]